MSLRNWEIVDSRLQKRNDLRHGCLGQGEAEFRGIAFEKTSLLDSMKCSSWLVALSLLRISFYKGMTFLISSVQSIYGIWNTEYGGIEITAVNLTLPTALGRDFRSQMSAISY